MNWYAVYDSETGQLYSSGSELGDPLPNHLKAVPLDGPPIGQWDPKTKTFDGVELEPALPDEDRLVGLVRQAVADELASQGLSGRK